MILTNETYDKLKWIAQILIPALGTLYFALCRIWGLPYGEQILGTVVSIDTFLGALLGLSSANYQGDGTMIVDKSDPEKDIYRMEINGSVDELGEKDQVLFKVRPAHMRKEEE